MLPFRLLFAPLAVPLMAAAPATIITLPIEAPFVDARVAGEPVRLRVSFDAPGPLTLTPEAVRRISLRSSLPSTILVGPVRLTGGSALVPLDYDGRRVRLQAIWGDRPPGEDGPEIDGIVSPAVLPVGGVRLVRSGVPAGRRRVLPAQTSGVTGLGFRETVGDMAVLVRLAPDRPETLATAASGALLADVRLGTLHDSAGRRTIFYGIARPVRVLSLARPFRVAGFAIRRLLVRSSDYAGTTRMPEEAMPESPDEIVVTGSNKASMPLYRVSLGADVLGRCAEIGWLANPPRLTLDCANVDGGETIG